MRDLRSVAKQTVLQVKPYVPGKPIEEVKRELKLTDVIKLASNENPYKPSPRVLQAIKSASLQINRYPDGGCHYLREKLAKFLKVRPEQLVFGNGSDELIVLAVRLFVGDKDEVVMAQPSFLVYSIASSIAGAQIKNVPLKDFHYDLPAMKKAITSRTRIVFLGNPDNPAGTYLKQKDVESFLEGIPQDVLVFIDEAYFEYVHARDYVNSIQLLKKYKNIIISRTFSKMYGLAGLRVGYGVCHKDLSDLFNRIREPFNVNSVAQAAAIACLEDQDYYRDIAEKVERERAYLYKNFERLGLNYQPSCTNFILLDVGQNGSDVVKRLLKRGVIVRDMGFWGMNQHIRISIGKRSENRQLISTLEQVL